MSEPGDKHRQLIEPPLVRRGDSLPLVTSQLGCHDCPTWHRIGSAIGECQAPGGPAIDSEPDVDRTGWLVSYVYCCPRHPRFKEITP